MTVKLPFDLKTFFLGDVQDNWIDAARCFLSPWYEPCDLYLAGEDTVEDPAVGEGEGDSRRAA